MPPGISSVVLLFLSLFAKSKCDDRPGYSENGDWLMYTITLTRHADRSASSESENYLTKEGNIVFFRGPGEITTEGIENARQMGTNFRNIYVKNGHVHGEMKPSQTFFRSSEVDRVLMTTAAYSSGLFKSMGHDIPAPIHTAPYNQDTLLGLDFSCTAIWDDQVAKYNLSNTNNMPDQILSQMRQSQWTCEDPSAYSSDTLLSEFANNLTRRSLNPQQKECAKSDGRAFMYSYVEALSGSGTNDRRARSRLALNIGNLANLTVAELQYKSACNSYRETYCDPLNRTASFYYAHDVHELAFMNIFSLNAGARDFFKGLTPNFGSSIVVELWARGTEDYIRMWVQDGVGAPFVEFSFCTYLPHGDDFPRLKHEPYCLVKALESAKNLYLNQRYEDIPCHGTP